jgi:NADH:quinone reductase (non-electrogenic)
VSKVTSAGPSVVVVGGGFAGVGCAKVLAKRDVRVTLLDQHNYHQFQPLLYQVATAELAASDVARSLRGIFTRSPSVAVKQLRVTSVDPATRTLTCAGGETFTGDYLVLAAGSRPRFYGTPGAVEHTFHLYTLLDARRLRSRLFAIFEEADVHPARIEQGLLNIVIVGGGPTGVETAGAVADLVTDIMPRRFHDLPVERARIYLVDSGPVVLNAFSDKAHAYAKRELERFGITVLLNTGVEEIRPDRVVLSDGTEILTRTVVWAGGVQAAALAHAAGLPQGAGGRLGVTPELSIEGYPRIYAVGDIANARDADGNELPQLGSVALQAGRWAARNILADIDGHAPTPFRYKDKGIMAMIGDGAAVAEVGPRHHELHGRLGFAAWLGVHAWLMSGVRQRVDAFIAWAWDFVGSSRSSSIIDDPEAAQIDWGDENEDDAPRSEPPAEGQQTA